MPQQFSHSSPYSMRRTRRVMVFLGAIMIVMDELITASLFRRYLRTWMALFRARVEPLPLLGTTAVSVVAPVRSCCSHSSSCLLSAVFIFDDPREKRTESIAGSSAWTL